MQLRELVNVSGDNSETSGVQFQAVLRLPFGTLNSLPARVKISELLHKKQTAQTAFQTFEREQFNQAAKYKTCFLNEGNANIFVFLDQEKF